MQVGVGYSDNPDSSIAGRQAVERAINMAGRSDSCDMVLLFSTVRHDQRVLREAVSDTVGVSVPIYGGGAVGIITNEYFGYAGDQIAAACIWLDGVHCEALIEGGLKESEEAAGIRLGQRLAALGTKPNAPVMMFYDALDCSAGVRMLMATWILDGIKKGLGFLPDLTGAGLMGDHICSPTSQWTGAGISDGNAIALAFSGDIRIDSVIMHGCRPATPYYTVTKAVGQVILEINGKPAIQFVDELLDSSIAPEDYPFFLIFGVNHGEKWGEYDEDYYASRLCLGIDKESGGIVMFEPDMVEGTKFQLMFRTLELDYIKPKIDKVFDELDGREPVFAIYIDCAGRCSGYAGMDLEDALVIQETVAGRVPVLGLYTGVEVASIGGQPRGLDWTGVFCLFSQSSAGSYDSDAEAAVSKLPVWDVDTSRSQFGEAPVEAMVRLCERNAAKILDLDSSSIAIRYELEQKRRGFSLLAELSVSLRKKASYEDVFIPVARRINAALNMQRTIVLVPDEKGLFTAEVLQGYTSEEKVKFSGRHIQVPAELLDPNQPVLITGADSEECYKEFRELLGIRYFISSPIILQDKVAAILLTGRLVEAVPYLIRLSRSDMETVQALSALLASVLAGQRLAIVEERNRIMADAMPMSCIFWNENGKHVDCNQETLSLFGLSSKEEVLERFYELSPEYQPDGRRSADIVQDMIKKAFVSGGGKFNWTYMTAEGELIPSEITFVRVPKGEDYSLAGYINDLRDQEAVRIKQDEARELVERYTRAKNEFLASVSHEIRTPMNAIVAMANAASESKELYMNNKNLVDQGMRSVNLLVSAIETILDFSKLDSGQLALEIEEFSVYDLVEDISEMTGKEARAKTLSFRASVDPDIPQSLLGDPRRLQQVLFNIVMNAVKFTETGGVEIHVFKSKAETESEHTLMLTFEVLDTGIGIGECQKSDLFKPFMTGDTSFSRRHGGLGMGLAVSQSLARLMGGEIICESRIGEGSTFSLTVPLAMPESKAASVQDASKEKHFDELCGMRVLVAEDNNINQMVMEALLSSVGIEVTIADNGLRVLEMLEKETFDVILMDIQMPEMDGLTATAKIRSNPKFDNLPVLAMTANAGAEHMEESKKAGMNGHLTKPVDAELLYRALKKWRKYYEKK